MGKFARIMGKVSGILAVVTAPINPAISAAFAANSAIMTAIGGKPVKAPPGSSTSITIGPNLPAPYIIGQAYYGGSRVTQVGYGEEDGVPNAHLWVVDVHSVAGPLAALLSTYADFTEVTYTGDNADDYYHNNLHRFYQLGETPESAALMPHWAGVVDWGSTYKISGKAALAHNARWAKKDNVFTGGFPQTGAVWQGVLCYDPRLDSTYPGGSGSHRWADPSDKVAFAAAKATWTYSNDIGLQALRYALGSWERDETDTDAEYQKVFGVGGKIDQVVVADFVALANLCDANGWTVNGVIFEPGDKFANLCKILAAGGASPVFKGGKLGLKINGPKVALDTITLADIGPGPVEVPGCRSYQDRKNVLIPKYIEPGNRWQPVAIAPVDLGYADEDGERREEEVPFDLVTDATQATQLAGVDLVNRRETAGIVLPLTPRLRGYRVDDCLAIDAAVKAKFGIATDNLVIEGSDRDLAQMTWGVTCRTETDDKYDAVYALTGTPPASTTNPAPEEYDNSSGFPPAYSAEGFNVVASGGGIVNYNWVNPVTAALDHSLLLVNSTPDYGTAADTGETPDPTPGGGVAGTLTGIPGPVTLYYWVQFFNASSDLLSVSGPVPVNVT